MSQSLRRLLNTYQKVIRPVAILGVVIVGFVFGVIPAAQTVWGINAKNQSLKTEIDSLSQKIRILESLDSESLKQDLAEFFAAIPTDKSAPSLLTTLENLTSQSGVSLLDVTLSGVGAVATASAKQTLTHASGAQIFRFSASVEGTMPQMLAFLRALSSVRRLLGVRSFDITITGTGTVSSKLEMETYFKQLPTELGSIASRVEPLSEKEELVLAKVKAFSNLGLVQALPPAALGPVKADPFSP